MTLAQVIDKINLWIIANGNNEITADVLRPILLDMLQQPNDLIGDLSSLNTSDNTNLVSAINSVQNDLNSIVSDGFVLLDGYDNPNNFPPAVFDVANFYAQKDIDNLVIALWVYNGVEWFNLKAIIDDANTSNVTTWSSQQIVDYFALNDVAIVPQRLIFTYVNTNTFTLPANYVVTSIFKGQGGLNDIVTDFTHTLTDLVINVPLVVGERIQVFGFVASGTVVVGVGGGCIDAECVINMPTFDTNLEASGLADYTPFKTSNGMLRYKLPDGSADLGTFDDTFDDTFN